MWDHIYNVRIDYHKYVSEKPWQFDEKGKRIDTTEEAASPSPPNASDEL